jgi:carbon monoxide dehydrogenase subunit G
MSTVTAQIKIAAPVEDVWNTVMDPDRLKDWVTIHRSVRNVSEKPLKRGATMDQSIAVRGVTFRVHWTLVSLERPHHAEWSGAGPAHSEAKIRYDLKSDGGDGTVFEYTNEFHPPGGRLGKMASRVIVGATSEREAKNSLSRLKSLLESGS